MSKDLQEIEKIERQAEVKIKFSHFEIPPINDALLIGKEAPIGCEAVRKMLQAVAPHQFEVIKITHEFFEGLAIKKTILQMIPKNRLIDLILEEGEKITDSSCVIKLKIDASIIVSKNITL